MRGARLTAARIASMVVLLVVGFGVSAAFADPGNGNGNGPPTTVPGSPGDDCSHGNAGADCRPDPNENGKDCEDHGQARGNEDHCDQAATTTTTTETTTTNETTTTSETTTSTPTTTVPGTTTTPASTGTTPSAAGSGSAATGTSGGAEPPATSNPPATKPELQKELAKQVAKVRHAGVAQARSSRGELPFTGFPTWALAILGSVLLATGLGVRRLTS